MSSFWVLCSEFYLIITHILLSLCVYRTVLIDPLFYLFISQAEESLCHALRSVSTLKLTNSRKQTSDGVCEGDQEWVLGGEAMDCRCWGTCPRWNKREKMGWTSAFISLCFLTVSAVWLEVPLSCLHLFPLDQTPAAVCCKLCFSDVFHSNEKRS